ncbi:MAG TPA: hypothetical protein VFS07_08980, partial [Gemmatimonadales bacterium]|nr:hypothetical protein [Gemmatimonadales bacterium]
MDPAYAWPPPPTLAEAPGWFRWLLTLARAVRDRLHVPWERVADADLSLRLVLALLAAALLVAAPMARAQDDDLPDGDVDLVEKPKPKAKKKDPP